MKKRKKFFILLAASVLVAGIAGAQHSNSPAGHVNFGVKGGVNLYDIHHDNSTKYDLKTGYHVGLLGHIHFNRKFAIQPELVLSHQGGRYSFENSNSNYTLDYLNIPVLFQYMFDNGFRLQAGPQAGFLISAKSKTDNNSVDIRDDYNAFDFGLSLGASYVFPSTGFGVDARYNFGLANINKNSSVYSTNRGLQLGVFYIFAYNRE